MDSETRTFGKALAKKILLVQQGASAIPKNGRNKSQEYSYVLASDAVNELRRLCVENNLVVSTLGVIDVKQFAVVKTDAGKDQLLTEVIIRYLVTDPDTGETVTFDWRGHGIDRHDKGIFKAYTGAHKYALMQFFMVPGDDSDPEKETAQDRREAKERNAQGQSSQGYAGQGQGQRQSAPGTLASVEKIRYIGELLKAEYIPGPVRGGMDTWLSAQKDKWSESGADKAVAGLLPFQSAGPKRGRSPVSDKQVAFIENLLKSSALPANLVTGIQEKLNNHRGDSDFTLTSGEASAMIECCNWYLNDRAAKERTTKQTPPAKTDEKPKADEQTPPDVAMAASEYDKIQDKLEALDVELARRKPPTKDHLQAYRDWRDSSKWTLEDCDIWLNTILTWPPTTKG